MSSISTVLYKVYSSLMCNVGSKNYILFESAPNISDNTLYVFNEMLKRGLNKKYKFIWALNNEDGNIENPFEGVKNVKVVSRRSFLFKYYYSYFAKCLICCNHFLPKRNKKQKVVYLAHGATVKDVRGDNYEVPESYKNDKGITLSDFTAKYDSKTLNAPSDFMLPLGYPRNDILFEEKIDLEKLFGIKADKFIYWLPTFRRHKNDSKRVCSSISIPVIHNEDNAVRLNEAAKENNVAIIVKPHPAQDLSYIKEMSLSNILFIDNSFLNKNGVENYRVLGSSDALLTDYSSVMYDYLLVNKPIGLCWEDIEEYKELEGLIFNDEELESVTRGCSKIYTCDDMLQFIIDLASDNDYLKQQREETRSFLHKYTDANSTARVTDYIEHLLKRV